MFLALGFLLSPVPLLAGQEAIKEDLTTNTSPAKLENDSAPSAGDVGTGASKTISGILEVRIMRAVISYQQRNILAYQYQLVPGFEMPRVLAIYGVRWDFWN